MKNGYRVRWTDNALKELGETFTFLEKNIDLWNFLAYLVSFLDFLPVYVF